MLRQIADSRESANTLTFQEAVWVLGVFRHGGCGEWYIRDQWAEPRSVAADYSYSEFEAIALAEIYICDQGMKFRVLSWESTHSHSDASVSDVSHIKLVTSSPVWDFMFRITSTKDEVSSS